MQISQEESSVYRKHAPVASHSLFPDSMYNVMVEDKDEKEADEDMEDKDRYGDSLSQEAATFDDKRLKDAAISRPTQKKRDKEICSIENRA